MLQLKRITKDYKVADSKVHALKGIDISFRKSEFVSILGPSGCGKTTLLNIIGGLDHYTSGDMFIDNISTKKFKDRDWDTYRNHRIGFVFQSYNLIPHQTVLENVELALTIGGVGKEERIKRAKKALDKVGLNDQYYKKPNQLSGGQCQRVAIARALVNEPDILLADEPTGALDTKTSVQIMDLLKEIAREKLVIMVTHNPELAETYSTRIVKLLDGRLISDTNPYTLFDKRIASKPIREKKSKLGIISGFKLSARNLRSKFKRTLMVCLAGSIGIIGVSAVLAVSTGITNYVADMQDDMLSGNPIQITEETYDLSVMLESMTEEEKNEIIEDATEDGKINVDYVVETLVKRSQMASNSTVKNDLNQNYLDYLHAMPEEYYAAIATYYGINVRNNIYTDIEMDKYGKQRLSLVAIENMYSKMLAETELKDYVSMISSFTKSFTQLPNNIDFVKSQYDIISGDDSYYATEANEIMLVVDDDEELTDLFLCQLGYYSQEEFFNICYRSADDDKYNPALDKHKFSYEELLGKTFTYYPNDEIYNKTTGMFASLNPFTYNAYEKDLTDGFELKITAILKPKEDINYGCLSNGFYYTPKFTKKVLDDALNSEIVTYLNESEKDSFTSTSFNGQNIGITYKLNYQFEGKDYENVNCFVGSTNFLSSMMGSLIGQSNETYTLSLRALGGVNLPNSIDIYPTNFEFKDEVTDYLDAWNNNKNDINVNGTIISKEDRSDVLYTDTLSIIIAMINGMIDVITYALIAFTALSLLVSTVMIAIITYVSVIERVKEIGVIRSLGGRKKDVSRLFNAEALIIGGLSGLIGIGVTYLLCILINTIVGNASGIYTIATLPVNVAIIMVLISILLTSISGLIPAKLAAKQDPVVALRSE